MVVDKDLGAAAFEEGNPTSKRKTIAEINGLVSCQERRWLYCMPHLPNVFNSKP